MSVVRRCRVTLAVLVVMFSTLRLDTTHAACPVPQSQLTVLSINSDPLPPAHCVFRATHSTTGDYALVCRDGVAVSGTVFGMPFTSGHTQLGTLSLSSVSNYRQSDVDAVDVGGAGPRRWVVQWNGLKSSIYTQLWFTTWDSLFLTPQSTEQAVFDPVGTEQSRWGNAVDVLPSSRRLVYLSSRYETHPPNSCSGSNHGEWRATINMRESGSLSQVPAAAKLLASATCSYTLAHSGTPGWGQENPDVSASWLFGDYFVVTWYDRANGCGVFARVFNANGVPVTSDIVVDVATSECEAGKITAPRVAAAGAGFMVVWTRTDTGALWMRTYNVFGEPLIASRLVNSSSLRKSLNPDIDVAVVDPCGDGYQVYFAVSWWAQTGSSETAPWTPQMLVLQDLTDPVPIIPGLGYVPLDSRTQPASDYVDDRVSIDFFNNANASDSACDDLTLGATWTMRSGTVEDIRKRILRFQPYCGASSSSTGDATQSFSPSDDRPCEPPDCIEFVPRARPQSEAEPVLPEAWEP